MPKVTVAAAEAESEFRTAPETKAKTDWADVINAIAKLGPNSKPLVVSEVVDTDTPEKNVARALAGAKRSLAKALETYKGPGGKPLLDFIEIGYIGTHSLGIRVRKG